MIQLNVAHLLEKSGKSLYWLSQQTNITYPALHRMVKNKTVSINFETLDLLCKAFKCTPNDVLLYTKED